MSVSGGSADKQLSDILFEKSTLWESTVDSVPWVMVLMNDQGSVLRTNREIQRWEVCNVEAAPGRPWHEVVHPTCVDDPCYLNKIFNRSNGGEVTGTTEVFDFNLRRWVLVEINRIALKRALPSGISVVILLTIRDVTKIRERHAFEIRATRAEATRFLVRGIAHEMGNPLAAMRTTLEVMMENMKDFSADKISDYLNRLYGSTLRLSEMIRKTLHENGKENLELSTIPTVQIVTDAMDVVMDFARGAGVEVVSRCDASLLYVDRIAAYEVLLNVVKNAIEACLSGGIVRIEGVGHWDCTQITILDDGVGMNSETLRRLFIPYCSNKALGSGIGLAYSNSLMTKMGGVIDVHSTKGSGTCVTLSFPHQSPVGEEDKQ